MSAALVTCRLLLAAVFFVAGAAKLADREGSRRALLGFGLSGSLARPLAILLPVAEVGVAAALLPRHTAWWGAAGALALLLAFMVAIAVSLARGQTPECHCFGRIHSAPAGWSVIARNALLAAAATYVLAQGPGGPGPSAFAWLGNMNAAALLALAAGIVTLLALAAGVWVLITLFRQHGRLLLRLEALESRLEEGAYQASNGNHHAGSLGVERMNAGEPAPPFRLPDLTGAPFELSDFRGSETLLLFWNPECGFCQAMLDDLKGWERDPPARAPKLVLVSTGVVEANRAMGLHSVILLDEEFEVAGSFGAPGTPSAVLIDAEAKIASEVAVGAGAVFQLAGGEPAFASA
jgi:peroxiredoxin